jgi:uncharacterized membrane protein YvbJ
MTDDWAACPQCGERIKRNAKSCRHCGSDDRTGWSDAAGLDSLDLPEPDDYDDGLEREGFRKAKPDARRLIAGAVGSILILLFLSWLLRGMF